MLQATLYNPAYFTAIENVISTPDLRSYWDLGGGALGTAPQRFMDVRFVNPIKPDAKLAITERWGNTPMHFQALDINGNVIAGSNTVFIGGASPPNLYQWNTGVNHSVNIPSQTQWIILFEASQFNTGTDLIYGFSVFMSTNDGGDGKILLFNESISAIPDFGSFDETSNGVILNVLANDELNGVSPPLASEVTITVVSDFPSTPTGGLSLDINTGDIIVQPDTPPGTYVLTYQICEVANPGNCDETTVTVINSACNLEDESYTTCPGTLLSEDVSDNDVVSSLTDRKSVV